MLGTRHRPRRAPWPSDHRFPPVFHLLPNRTALASVWTPTDRRTGRLPRAQSRNAAVSTSVVVREPEHRSTDMGSIVVFENVSPDGASRDPSGEEAFSPHGGRAGLTPSDRQNWD